MQSLLSTWALGSSAEVRIARHADTPLDTSLRQENHQSQEQRIARALLREMVAQCSGIPDYLPAFDENGRPCWKKGICWSITHKSPWVAVAISRHPIGIDLETLVERDTALFSFFSSGEWDILGSRDWLRFYMLWTAKEAVIKRERGTIDALRDIRLTGYAEGKLLLSYHGKRIPVRPTVTDAYVYSLSALDDTT